MSRSLQIQGSNWYSKLVQCKNGCEVASVINSLDMDRSVATRIAVSPRVRPDDKKRKHRARFAPAEKAVSHSDLLSECPLFLVFFRVSCQPRWRTALLISPSTEVIGDRRAAGWLSAESGVCLRVTMFFSDAAFGV